MKNWKTTLAGILSAFIATVGPVTAYLATTNSPKATSICGVLTLAGAIARVWVGIISQDAKPAPPPNIAMYPSVWQGNCVPMQPFVTKGQWSIPANPTQAGTVPPPPKA